MCFILTYRAAALRSGVTRTGADTSLCRPFLTHIHTMGNTESSLGHAGTLGGRSSASYPLTPRRGPTSAPLQFATFTTLETFRVSNSSLQLDPMGVDDGVGGSGKVSRRKAERKGSRGTATRSSTMNVFARARAKAAKATKQRFRELKGVESVSVRTFDRLSYDLFL